MAYFKNSKKQSTWICLHDFIMAAFACYLSFQFFKDASFLPDDSLFITKNIIVFSLLALGASSFTRLFEEALRPFSWHVTRIIAQTTGLTVLFYIPLLILMNAPHQELPIYFGIVLGTFYYSCLIIPRLIFLFIQQDRLNKLFKPQKAKFSLLHNPAVIIGINNTTKEFVSSWFENKFFSNEVLEPVGIISLDVIEKLGSIGPCPILGNIDDLNLLMERVRQRGHHLKHLIITDLDIPRSVYQELLTLSKNHKMDIYKLITDNQNRLQLIPLTIQDIIGYLKFPKDLPEKLEHYICNKTVLITGGAGLIGSKLANKLCEAGAGKIIIIDQCDYSLYNLDQELERKYPLISRELVLANLKDQHHIHSIFERTLPHIVIHAAHSKPHGSIKQHYVETLETNILGLLNVIKGCEKFGVPHLMLLSPFNNTLSNTLFDQTLKAAEIIIQLYDLKHKENKVVPFRFLILRLCNVVESKGGLINTLQYHLQNNEADLLKSSDIKISFVSLEEAAQSICQMLLLSGENPNHGKVFTLAGKEALSLSSLINYLELLNIPVLSADIRDEKITSLADTVPLLSSTQMGTHYEALDNPIPTAYPHLIELSPPLRDCEGFENQLSKLEILIKSRLTEQAEELLNSLISMENNKENSLRFGKEFFEEVIDQRRIG